MLTNDELYALQAMTEVGSEGPPDLVTLASSAMAKLRANQGDMARPSWEDMQRVADMAVFKYHQQAFVQHIGHEMFRVPNNWRGRIIRWILGRYLNRRVYKMVARGRKATDGKRHMYSIPHAVAGELAIYIYTKRGHE